MIRIILIFLFFSSASFAASTSSDDSNPSMPASEQVTKLYEKAYESPAGPISPIDMIYGHRGFIEKGDHYMSHKSGFTLKNLLGVLKHCGFQSVAGIERPNVFDLWVVGKKKKIDQSTFQSFVRSVIQTI